MPSEVEDMRGGYQQLLVQVNYPLNHSHKLPGDSFIWYTYIHVV